ncbi:MAG: nucleoside kinase [Chloroflexota bacterium]
MKAPKRKIPQATPTSPRQTVQARLPNGALYQASVGAPIETFIAQALADRVLDPSIPVVAALVNGRLCELTYTLHTDADLSPIPVTSGDGTRIYQRSLCFLLVTAVRQLFPEARIVIDHSLTAGGLFCTVQGREPFSLDELARIEKRMQEIAHQDEPITKRRIPLDQARALFENQGYQDKVRLLKYRRKDYLTVYSLCGTEDYFYGYMVPSAGYVKWFDLKHYPPGFILRYPLSSRPQEMPAFRDSPRLATVFREYGQWLQLMEVDSVSGLNRAIEDGRIRELILVAEALHEQRIAHIARDIAARHKDVRLVLIAGPSSSGKTTFVKRLAVQLLANGIRPVVIGMDDYFVERHLTPRTANGEYDYESLTALDLALFNEHLLQLMAYQSVALPHYNFHTGRRDQGHTISLRPDQIILAEGIHGLNPKLVPAIPAERIYRVYVSALTNLNIDHHNRVPTTDTRLLRRLIRDAAYRGYSAQETIDRWASVRRGEGQNIFPFQEHADAIFNSALAYELAVLKPFAEPLLRQVEPGTMNHIEAKRLLAFLQWFLPCEPEPIPDNSILREFIGGSILRDYSP